MKTWIIVFAALLLPWRTVQAQQPVTWEELTGLSFISADEKLEKTLDSPNLDDNGALSMEWLPINQDGLIRYTYDDGGSGFRFGFCALDASTSSGTVLHGFRVTDSGDMDFLSNGSWDGTFNGLMDGDVLTLVREEGWIDYLVNDVSVYTSPEEFNDAFRVLAQLENQHDELTRIETDFKGDVLQLQLPVEASYRAEMEILGSTFDLPEGEAHAFMLQAPASEDISIRIHWYNDSEQQNTSYELTYSNTSEFQWSNVRIGENSFTPDLNMFVLDNSSQLLQIIQFLDDIRKTYQSFAYCHQDGTTSLNFVQEILYDGSGAVWQQSKTYTDGLGRQVFSLVQSPSDATFLATAPAFDAFGRASAYSLEAPTYNNTGCYNDQFFTNTAGDRYDYEDYASSTYEDLPAAVGGTTTQGTLGWYYSNNNTDEGYVAASDYPFQTAEFFAEPGGRTKRKTTVGEHHRMGSGHETQTYYLGHAGELTYIYGLHQHYIEGKMQDIHAAKTVNIDADGHEYVTYANEFGKVIATCRSGLNGCLDQKVTRYLGGQETPTPVDIHLHHSKKSTLVLDYFPIKYSFNNQVLVTYSLTDLATNYTLVEGTDYTINSTTRAVSFIGSTYGSAGWNSGSRFFRVSMVYDAAHVASLANFSTGGVIDPNAFGLQEVRYELDYSHWTYHYYNRLGNVVKTVTPEGVDCDVYDPTLQASMDAWTYYEPCYSSPAFQQNTLFGHHYDATAIGTTKVRNVYINLEINPSMMSNIDVDLQGNPIPLCDLHQYFDYSVQLDSGLADQFVIAPAPGTGPGSISVEPGNYLLNQVPVSAASTYQELVDRVMTVAAAQDSGFAAAFKNSHGGSDPTAGQAAPPAQVCELCNFGTFWWEDGQGQQVSVSTGDCAYASTLTYNQAVARGTSRCLQYGRKLGSVKRVKDGPIEVWCMECGEVEQCMQETGRFIAEFKVPVRLYTATTAGTTLVETRDLYATLRSKICHTTAQTCGYYWDDLRSASVAWRTGTVEELLPTTDYDILLQLGDFEVRTQVSGTFRSFQASQPRDQFMRFLGVRANLVHEELLANPQYTEAPVNMANTYTYDPMGNLVEDETPDAGSTEFVHDHRFRVVFSRNAEQAQQGLFSYTLYDYSNRPVETGEFNQGHAANTSNYRFQAYGEDPATLAPGEVSTHTITNSPESLPVGARQERVFLQYDHYTLPVGFPSGYTQQYTDGQLVRLENDHEVSYFSYDMQGRLDWQVNYDPDASTYHTFDYSYDILGNVMQVAYQQSVPAEAFYYHFTYDAGKRLQRVATSLDGTTQQVQARYIYYTHGPLKRVELADGFQGMDYVYTLQGWLKSINAPELDNRDPGQDGYGASTVPQDVFGLTLDYHAGDYTRKSTFVQTYTNEATDGNGLTDSYTGLVKAQRWQTRTSLLSGGHGALAHTGSQLFYGYRYDAFQRLTEAVFDEVNTPGARNNGSGSLTGSPALAGGPADYHVRNLSYDRNGNLLSLQRDAHGTGRSMDNFTYCYTAGSNRLRHLNDAVGITAWTQDLDDQGTYDPQQSSTWNYTYDALGRMTQDGTQGHYLTYTAAGLVEAAYADAAHTELLARFYYNGTGQRVRKEVYQYNSGTGLNDLLSETRYANDAQGLPYLVDYTEYDPATGTVVHSEQDHVLYGASRLGTYTRSTAEAKYEVTDHLGNVRAVFTPDVSGPGKAVTLLTVTDYYPFGSVMPGRSANQSAYRYTYQGQEYDASLSWNAFELRTYDGRLGRWANADPYRQHASPFVGMGNNPVSRIDPDGGADYYIDGMLVSSAQYNSFANASDGNISVTGAGLSPGTFLGYEYNGNMYYGDKAYGRMQQARQADIDAFLGGLGIQNLSGGLFSSYNRAYTNQDLTRSGGTAGFNYLGEYSDIQYLFNSENSLSPVPTTPEGVSVFKYEERKEKGGDNSDANELTNLALGLSPAGTYMDIYTVFTGEEYVTGNKVTGIWRYAGIIPWVSEFRKIRQLRKLSRISKKESTDVYRAVSQAELDDISQHGLRNKSGAYETGKLFAPTAGEAAQYGRNNFRFDGLPNTVVKVRVPNDVLNQSHRFPADGMNAISIPAEILDRLKATPLNYSPIK